MCDFSDSSEDRMNIHKNARLTPLGRDERGRRRDERRDELLRCISVVGGRG